MDKNISYLNRTFDDYRSALIEYSKKYYPTVTTEYDDASVGSWMIDINAEIADNLSYHIDRVVQETNISSAKERASLFAIARNNGLKIPGPKGAMAEVMFSCQVPVGGSGPNEIYCPIIKRGTRVAAGSQIFELLNDVDFSKQFDTDGNSDREIVPVYNSNNQIAYYKINKLAVVVAGETRIYKQTISASDIKPFMEILIPVYGVMNIESILVVDGTDNVTNPTYGQFYMNEESCSTAITRFFEVTSLAQQRRWGDAGDAPVVYAYSDGTGNTDVDTYCITKGEWKPLRHKFITEYTDKGYLKVIFGNGTEDYVPLEATDFSKYQISRVLNNPSLGYLPKANSTLFILYRVGGGESSNVAAGAINSIRLLNVEFSNDNNIENDKLNIVRSSISCKSTTPSVSGKDMPTTDEIRYLIKYNAGAQERCVTVKDYVSRIYQLPPKYGTPYRVGVMEANNKIMIFLLGIDYQRHLDATLPKLLAENIQNYLAGYRMINDFVEIKSGKIVNLSFEVDMFIDRNYNKTDVISAVIARIRDYMDISRHNMGDDIFVGDIEKEITKLDGVISIIDFRVYNNTGGGYSSTPIQQPTMQDSDNGTDEYRELVDLEASDGVLYSDGDTMFEIKNPERDIVLRVKER